MTRLESGAICAEICVYSEVTPRLGWRGALVLPTQFGDVIFRGEIPPGALEAWMHGRVGYHDRVGAPDGTLDIVGPDRVGAPDGTLDIVGPDRVGYPQGFLDIVGGLLDSLLPMAQQWAGTDQGKQALGIASMFVPGLGVAQSLMGGQPPPGVPGPPMPGGAPGGGGFGGIGQLVQQLATPQGQSLAASVAQAVSARRSPPAGAAQVPATLGGAGLLMQAAQSPTVSRADVASIVRSALRAMDARAAELAGDQRARDAITRARQDTERDIATALAAANRGDTVGAVSLTPAQRRHAKAAHQIVRGFR